MPGITIQIEAGTSPESCKANASGSLQHIVTEDEKSTFGIHDGDLKRKIGERYGRQPEDAFVKSPTPWDDLYQRFGWEQIQAVITPIGTEILSVDAVPTIISRQVFKNDRANKSNFNAKISAQVSNTVATSWSQNYVVTFNQEIGYGMKFLGVGVDGTTSFGFQSEWGKSETREQTRTVGMETGVSVDLEPGEEVVAELSANLGKMRVRITYEAHLIGQAAVNYCPTFEDHHFYGYYISDVLGDSNSVNVTQDIEIGFYTEAHANIMNPEGVTLSSESACYM